MILAIGRLERAIARAERAVATRPAATQHGDGDGDGAALRALTARHERLKDETRAAIAAIDALLDDAGV